MGHTTLMPAFAGVQPAAKGRALRVSQHAASTGPASWYENIEVMVTIPNIGQRTRIEVTKEKKVDEVKKEARVLLGLTQDFLKDEDFHMYFARDESIELDPKAKLGDYPDLYKPWSPDGFEIHMRYEPRKGGFWGRHRAAERFRASHAYRLRIDADCIVVTSVWEPFKAL